LKTGIISITTVFEQKSPILVISFKSVPLRAVINLPAKYLPNIFSREQNEHEK